LRVAAVTGASRNIGRSIALALAEQSIAIACLGRDRPMLDETVGLVEANGGRASAHVGDISDDGSAATFVDQVLEIYERLDVVVNNAGITGEAPSATTDLSLFRKVIDVNLIGAFALSQAAYPALTRGEDAIIVNVGSIYGQIGVPKFAAYCASKAALDGLTRALAAEWARDGIRVVSIAPGYVMSDISAEALADDRSSQGIIRRIPQRRVATADEVGVVVAMLADRRCRYITGATLVMDGGQISSI